MEVWSVEVMVECGGNGGVGGNGGGVECGGNGGKSVYWVESLLCGWVG